MNSFTSYLPGARFSDESKSGQPGNDQKRHLMKKHDKVAASFCNRKSTATIDFNIPTDDLKSRPSFMSTHKENKEFECNIKAIYDS